MAEEEQSKNPLIPTRVFATRVETVAVAFEIGVMVALYADVVIRSASRGQDLTYLHLYIDNSQEPKPDLVSNVVVNCAFAVSYMWFYAFEAVIHHSLSCAISEEDQEDLFRSSLLSELRVFTPLIVFLFVKVAQDISYLALLGPGADNTLQGVVIVDFILCLVHLCYVRGHAITLENDSRGLDEINCIASFVIPLVFAVLTVFVGVWLSFFFWLKSCSECYGFCSSCWSYDEDNDEDDDDEIEVES